jgi:hypothetical protein
MKTSISPDRIAISSFDYDLEVTRDSLTLVDPRTGHRLFSVTSPLIFYPELSGGTATWQVTDLTAQDATAGAVKITVSGQNGRGASLNNELACWPDHIEVSGAVTVPSDDRIAHWHLLGQDVGVNLFHVHHFRNRHGHTRTYETHNLLQGSKKPEEVTSPGMPKEYRDAATRVTDITTYSYDWQFNPHPSFLLLQRDSVMLGIGAKDLPKGFGLELRAGGQKLEYLRYNYGGEMGLSVVAGETSAAPTTYLWCDHNGSVWNSVDHYVEMLQEDGAAPRRSLRNVPHWWLQPAYCTWGDQGFLSGSCAYYNFPGDEFQGKHPVASFDGAMLDHLLDTLEKEAYNFGTVIIDDGWQKTRGDWEPDTKKFPNLRAQIDRIHALGMKAILWLAPYDFYPDAEIRKKTDWLCGGGTPGRHGMPMVDFSNPKVQDEYLTPQARFFFSDDDDCLNADGLKLDFMADKVHPHFPIYNPDWRGEERFSLGWQTFMYQELKRWKPDGQMIGGTVHPAFIGCQDLIRTYDVPGSQSQHTDRAKMIRHFNPGNLATLDMGETKSLADVEEHVHLGLTHNLLYECGRIAPDPETGISALGEDYAPFLKRKLKAWGDTTPRALLKIKGMHNG